MRNGTSASAIAKKGGRKRSKTKYRTLDLWNAENGEVQKRVSSVEPATKPGKTEMQQSKPESQRQERRQNSNQSTVARGGTAAHTGSSAVEQKNDVSGRQRSKAGRRYGTGGKRTQAQRVGVETHNSSRGSSRDGVFSSGRGQCRPGEGFGAGQQNHDGPSSPRESNGRQDARVDQSAVGLTDPHAEQKKVKPPEKRIGPMASNREGWLSVPDVNSSGEPEGSSRVPISTEDFQALWSAACTTSQNSMDLAEADPSGKEEENQPSGGSGITNKWVNRSSPKDSQATGHRKKRWRRVGIVDGPMLQPAGKGSLPSPAASSRASESGGDDGEPYVLVVSRVSSTGSSNLGGDKKVSEKPPAGKLRMWSKKDVKSRILSKAEPDRGKPNINAVHSAVTATGSPEYCEAKCGLVASADGSKSDSARKRKLVVNRDFIHLEKMGGKKVNVVSGLELHNNVLSIAEQAKLVHCIEKWLLQGEKGQLVGRTYTAPAKSMKGKGRRTVQFGCCYNYAVDNKGRPPGILTEEAVEPMPPILAALAQRLVRWGILPSSKVPDSSIVNVYEEGDCIPPHIDNHDFVRPFVTISLLSTAPINFGVKLKVLGPGEFSAPYQIMLPPGSCLILKGNGADVAQHCIPSVKNRRISITFRKMGNKFRHTIEKSKVAQQHGWSTASSAFNPT